MSEVPGRLTYTSDHEWLLLDDDGLVTVGITDHAQAALGELVFVELPEPGAAFGANDPCAVVESVKAASDVYCPVAGEIAEVNEALSDEPERVNNSPYEDGWIFRLRPENGADLDELLDADAYERVLAALED